MLRIVLASLWAGLCSIDDMGTQMLRRPLLIAPLTGLIFGDLSMGLLIGATLEIMWMGVGNVGAYSAPDMITGSVISTALAIKSGGGVAMAVGLAVPTSLLAQQLLVLYRSSISFLNPIANRIAETGDFKKVFRINYIPISIVFLIRAVPTFLAIYFGGDAVVKIVESLPANIMTGLSNAGKIIPAVGIGLLMQMMIRKSYMWIFLVAGFVLATYLKLSILPITLLSLPLALLYDLATTNNMEKDTGLDSEGGYDL